MAMGKKRARQPDLWISTDELPHSRRLPISSGGIPALASFNFFANRGFCTWRYSCVLDVHDCGKRSTVISAMSITVANALELWTFAP